MRLLFSWGNVKLVIPVPDENSKVESLLAYLSNRTRAETTLFDSNNRFIRLLLNDYALNPGDTIKDVLRDGDVVSAVDYQTYLKEAKQECTDYWTSVEAPDFSDDSNKWARIGLSKQKKLFIMLGSNYRVTDKLEMFSQEELTNWSKPGKHLIATLEGKDWYVQAHAVAEGTIVKAIILTAKSPTLPKAQIKNVELAYGDQISMASATLVQDCFELVHKEYSLPEESRTGPVLAEDTPVTEGSFTDNVSQGEAPVELRQLDSPYPEQYWSGENGFQNIFCEFLLTNTLSEPVTILKFTSEYLVNDEWKPALNTYIGNRDRGNFYSCRQLANDLLTLDGKSHRKIALRSCIEISGLHYHNLQGRIYPTLPRPLKLRFRVIMTDNKQSTITVEVNNRPLDLPNKSKFVKEMDSGQNLLAWVYCDDTTIEHRIWIGVAYDPSKDSITITNRMASRSIHLTRISLLSYAYNAIQSGKDEVEVTDIGYEHDCFVMKCFLLVDKQTHNCYAMRVELKTSTSSTVSHVAIPISGNTQK